MQHLTSAVLEDVKILDSLTESRYVGVRDTDGGDQDRAGSPFAAPARDEGDRLMAAIQRTIWGKMT